MRPIEILRKRVYSEPRKETAMFYANKAFYESQKQTDKASNEKAEKLIREHPVARQYYEAIRKVAERFSEK